MCTLRRGRHRDSIEEEGKEMRNVRWLVKKNSINPDLLEDPIISHLYVAL